MKTINYKHWRTKFHIQPPSGLLNDPNGLIYHEGIYHVFYQWHPDGPVHGLKYWNHVTSTDLVHWKKDSSILKPDSPYDSHGAYSGSAIVHNNNIELFYTGNTRTDSDLRLPYQINAQLGDEGILSKEVIIDHIPEGYTDHFRDPKVFKTNNGYTMIIGAQRTNLTGSALIYESNDLKSWQLKKELSTQLQNYGFMWECPDLFKIDNTDILLFCPQGTMNSPKENTNIYPNAYILGHYDDKNHALNNHSEPKLIDYGFDFYAAQTFLDEDNQRVLLAWVGSAEGGYPSDVDGWAHMLTIPRVLSIKDNVLYQTPHSNLKKLKLQEVPLDSQLEIYELYIQDIEGSVNLNLYRNNNESIGLQYNASSRELTIDRSNMLHGFAKDRGETRSLILDEDLKSLHVYRDTSIFEIFINDGRYTMTLRFFPQNSLGTLEFIEINKTANMILYELEDVNHDL